MAGPDAVMTGWEWLRDVMRSIEIRSREQFAEWIHNQGSPMPRWGGYISARVQERTLNIAVAHDARVSALESVFVSVTLGECDQTLEPFATVPRPVTPHASGSFSDSCWEMLDRVNLQEVFESRFRTLLGRVVVGSSSVHCHYSHRVCKSELCRRMAMFCQGAWEELMHEAFASVSNERRLSPSGDSDQRRAEVACRKVQLGEVSRARQCLTGASLAPGTEATFREIQSRRPQEVQRPIPREVLEFEPATPLVVDRKMFLKSLKSAPRGASPGLGVALTSTCGSCWTSSCCSRPQRVLPKRQSLLTSRQH